MGRGRAGRLSGAAARGRELDPTRRAGLRRSQRRPAPAAARPRGSHLFRPDPTLPFVSATRDRVVALVESINQPQISIPSKAPQAATGHLCGLRNPDGSLSVYVSLWLPQSGENVVYVHEPRELPIEAYREAEAEGLQFLESMGFMLDNLNFRNLSTEQQQRTLERVPLFSRPRPSRGEVVSRERARSPEALARLLASF